MSGLHTFPRFLLQLLILVGLHASIILWWYDNRCS